MRTSPERLPGTFSTDEGQAARCIPERTDDDTGVLRRPGRTHGNAPVSVREVAGVVWASQGDGPRAGSARPVRAGAGLRRRRPGRLTRSSAGSSTPQTRSSLSTTRRRTGPPMRTPTAPCSSSPSAWSPCGMASRRHAGEAPRTPSWRHATPAPVDLVWPAGCRTDRLTRPRQESRTWPGFDTSGNGQLCGGVRPDEMRRLFGLRLYLQVSELRRRCEYGKVCPCGLALPVRACAWP